VTWWSVVEPHGREETSVLLRGLEVVPRKRIEYRGVTVEELDLDAVIARRPQVAVVDEVAHTNAPGSRNRKRYEDILDLLGAGINVIAAFNVQHLESLKDLVERATGVTVHETVPDTFLKKADQVVTLDLAVEDLLERLRAGKIYREEKIALALENFFKEANLATLRELVLREVAESVERSAAATARAAITVPREAVGDPRLHLVPVPGRQLLRRASRMADGSTRTGTRCTSRHRRRRPIASTPGPSDAHEHPDRPGPGRGSGMCLRSTRRGHPDFAYARRGTSVGRTGPGGAGSSAVTW
jgi:two-component system sensor histidine kinase KdpD